MELENAVISSTSSSSAGSREYKVVMLGAGGVGKSAMTMQFISHRFPDYHDPTIEDAYKTQVRIDDEPAYLDILDTAGQAEFTAMRDQYMRGGEGFIICYSITDRQSFQEAAEFKELIYRVRHTYDIPVVLVGNKIDLEEFRQTLNLQKQLKKARARRFPELNPLLPTDRIHLNRSYNIDIWCQQ
ncbi:GTP-binding protein Rit2 isoform X2 [Lonchura striata]